jgi:uncharacterized membrane protein
MKRWLLIGLILTLAGVALVAYSVLTPTVTQTGGSGAMGSGQSQTHYSYPDVNIVLSIVGSVMATLGGTLLFLYRENPLSDSGSVNNESSRMAAPALQNTTSTTVDEVKEEPAPVSLTENIAAMSETNVVLRLLEGDERAMFRALIEKGGEALQKDLIVATKMSDAKASRVLDRLMEKGVVQKERHGMTNKVRVRIDH